MASSPTSIVVTFVPPFEIEQNGPITSYNISYTGEIFYTDTQFVTVNITNRIYPAVAQVSFNLTGLQEYNNYTISVSAINGEGSSEFTAGVIQITDEAGKSVGNCFVQMGITVTAPPNSEQPLNNKQPSWHGLNLAYVR